MAPDGTDAQVHAIRDRLIELTFAPSIMHPKFWLFSQVEGASNVVVQTTANMTPGAFTRFYNDAVLLPDNRTPYSAYSTYFRDMLGRNWAGWRYRSVTSGNGLYKAYFFPRSGTTRRTRCPRRI